MGTSSHEWVLDPHQRNNRSHDDCSQCESSTERPNCEQEGGGEYQRQAPCINTGHKPVSAAAAWRQQAQSTQRWTHIYKQDTWGWSLHLRDLGTPRTAPGRRLALGLPDPMRVQPCWSARDPFCTQQEGSSRTPGAPDPSGQGGPSCKLSQHRPGDVRTICTTHSTDSTQLT